MIRHELEGYIFVEKNSNLFIEGAIYLPAVLRSGDHIVLTDFILEDYYEQLMNKYNEGIYTSFSDRKKLSIEEVENLVEANNYLEVELIIWMQDERGPYVHVRFKDACE